RGALRAVVTAPPQIVPDPRETPPVSDMLEDPRACDPLNLDPRFAIEDPPVGVDREEWSVPRRGSLVWRVGAGIAPELRTAEAIALEEPDPPPPPSTPKRSRRLWRATLCATILAALAGYFAWTKLDVLPRAGAFLGIAIVWLLLIANAARKALLKERGAS